jgi:hypothetical protein
VNDEKETPGSGSRWEPGVASEPGMPATDTPTPAEGLTTERPTEEVPHHAPTGQLPPYGVPDVTVVPAGRRGLRGRVALAGVGAALAVAGGVGGFALGYAAAGNDVHEASVVRGADPGHDVGGNDGDGVPGRPGFGDRGTRPDPGGAVPRDPDGDGSGSGDSSGDGTT